MTSMKLLNNQEQKKARKTVEELRNKGTKKADTVSQNNTTVNSSFTALQTIAVPGLSNYNPDSFSAMLPSFNADDYGIQDPLNPSDKLPQVTLQQFDKGSSIYEGTQRALKLTQQALDTTRERFVTIGKHAKTVNAGIQASTEIERVKGSYLGYLNEVEKTTQANIQLATNQYKTLTDTQIAVHTKAELDEKLALAANTAELAKLKRIEALGKLSEIKKQLGDYLPVNN